MTFVKVEVNGSQPSVETSAFLPEQPKLVNKSLLDIYETERVNDSRFVKQDYSIIQTVKKGAEGRLSNYSSVNRSGFYGKELLDLVEFLDK